MRACLHETTRYVNQHGFPIFRLCLYQYARATPLSVHYKSLLYTVQNCLLLNLARVQGDMLLVLTEQWKRASRDRSSSEKQWMNDIDMLVTIGVSSQKQHRIQPYFSYSRGTLQDKLSSIQTVAKYSKIPVMLKYVN